MSNYASLPSSFTSQDQATLIEHLSTDGTLEGISSADVLRLIEGADASGQVDIAGDGSQMVSVEDLAFLYSYLTGSVESSWEATLVSPDDVENLSEWADLTTNSDLESDLRELIAKLGPDAELETALSGTSSGLVATNLGDVSAMKYSMDEIVNCANDWYAVEATSISKKRDYKGLIELGFATGNVMLVAMTILQGTDDEDGLFDVVKEGVTTVADHLQDTVGEIIDLNDENQSLDPTDAEDSALLSANKTMIDLHQSTMSIETQTMTSLSGILSDTIDAMKSMLDMQRATNQRIWS